MTQLRVWAGLLGCLMYTAAIQAASPKPAATVSPWLLEIYHEPRQPRSGQEVKVVAKVSTNVTEVKLEYQVVEPGAYVELKDRAYREHWIPVPMQADGRSTEPFAFEAKLPGEVQKHRRLIRYRISALDARGRRGAAPDPSRVPPNFTYFVYDGLPAWTGAINPRSRDSRLSAPATFSSETMSRVQAWHLIGRKQSVENATWNEQSGGKEYKYTGTLVVGDEVFDHVGFRARGGVWRYAMGKNMWKFNLPGDQTLHARDDFGHPYPIPWTKVNLRSCIQQGDYGQRGEQGLFESVGFRLFNLAGVPAPFTHWIQLRIIDEANENPSDQYRGDFWGLYLAIENEDGRFLKAHGLPSGNLYKMVENGSGELEHHGTGAVTNRSDLDSFLGSCRRGHQSEAWWRSHLDLAGYYSYRAICECIHHYDIGEGKNYDYYLNPVTGKWQVIPWDIDLTWANNMFGNGEEPFKRLVLSRPVFRLEYQNRLREIRDLLFNPEQTGRLIDQYAAVIWDSAGAPSMVEADRRKWDYHPMMARAMKAGHGLFYQAARTKNFPGMVRVMKDYVKSRGAWIDSVLLNDPNVPATPRASFVGPANFPANQLRFRSSAYQGADDFAALKWRLAEVTPTNSIASALRGVGLYEITPVWESPELRQSEESIAIPDGLAKPGRTYRVRVRMKAVTGRWSHWSAPVEFVAGTSP